ncbi:CobW family GTP-binding protein [Paenibacillus senegalimassiliensis]|uniref:CobW family GTP-binding protein n=1 Tax=Paenibacillus senegalimassiliensis TaxID=1737426 RepID=UPI00073FA2B8|nr:CobW family GTP-binding protein [Paenibacillus senegalimassiliensis]
MSVTPVYILSGFLGSGKTTLLQRLITHWQGQGLRPAIVMNEIGDVNLDGLLVSTEVPMAEMLGGCICCTIRGDLSVQLSELIEQEHPDLIVIEATGAGNPLEIFDAVTEVSLYMKLDLKPMITVVDALHLADLHASQQGKTYRLMIEQIRCGSVLVMNKVDLIHAEQQKEMTEFLQHTSPFARIIPAVKCEVDVADLLEAGQAEPSLIGETAAERHVCNSDCHDHEHHHHHDNEHHEHSHSHDHAHASHEHVTVYTHYFHGPIDSTEFERFISELPREVYRGKGILRFSDTSSRFLFQYAYRESDFLKVTPQKDVPDVAVFIGEHFDRNWIAQRLEEMEQKQRDLV